jgi:integrase
MRSGEMLGLTWERVDLGKRLFYLAPEDQKNNTEGSVPINEQSRQVLMWRFQFQQQYYPESEFVYCNKDGNRIKCIKRSFNTACAKAGIKDFTPHGLIPVRRGWCRTMYLYGRLRNCSDIGISVLRCVMHIYRLRAPERQLMCLMKFGHILVTVTQMERAGESVSY